MNSGREAATSCRELAPEIFGALRGHRRSREPVTVAFRSQQEVRFGTAVFSPGGEEIRRAPDVGELLLEKTKVQDQLAPRAPKPVESLIPLRVGARVDRLSQGQRRAPPIVPVEEALRAENLEVRLGFDVVDLDENPLEAARFRLQDLLEDIEIFRRIHPVDAEIEGPGRDAVLARDLVESFRRNRVVETARPEKKGVELVLVLREEFQFFRDAFGNGRRQERVINKARRQQGAEPKGDANESMRELFRSHRLVLVLVLAIDLPREAFEHDHEHEHENDQLTSRHSARRCRGVLSPRSIQATRRRRWR